MDCKTAVVYHEIYNGRGFSRLKDSWQRYGAAAQKFVELGLTRLDGLPHPELPVQCYRPESATIEELASVHSRAYIEQIIRLDRTGEGYFDRSDTPIWQGVYRRAAVAVGGTLLAADLVGRGEAKHVFHPAGGLHHAHYDKASGFCIFNDIVAAVRRWQSRYGLRRIAVIDVDGHHGDGTQSLLYHEPILTISAHQYDGRFFPGTGAMTERGEGAGAGFSLNIPLPRYTTDLDYAQILTPIAHAVEAYKPEAIIVQFGVDGHFSDKMGGLKLSTYTYEKVARLVHELAHRYCQGRLVVVGGGGYVPETVARCWGILLANLAGQVEPLGYDYANLHDPLDSLPRPDEQAGQKVANTVKEILSFEF